MNWIARGIPVSLVVGLGVAFAQEGPPEAPLENAPVAMQVQAAYFEEGTQDRLTPQDLKDLLPWAQVTKLTLDDIKARGVVGGPKRQLEQIEARIRDVVLDSRPRRSEVLTRYSLNRALKVAEMMYGSGGIDAAARHVGTVNAVLNVYREAVDVALSYWADDLAFLDGRKTEETPFVRFGLEYAGLMERAANTIEDEVTQSRILESALGLLQYDLHRSAENLHYSPVIIKIERTLRGIPANWSEKRAGIMSKTQLLRRCLRESIPMIEKIQAEIIAVRTQQEADRVRRIEEARVLEENRQAALRAQEAQRVATAKAEEERRQSSERIRLAEAQAAEAKRKFEEQKQEERAARNALLDSEAVARFRAGEGWIDPVLNTVLDEAPNEESIALLPSNREVVMGAASGLVQVVDLVWHEAKVSRKLEAAVNAIALVGAEVAVGLNNGVIHLLNLETLETRLTLRLSSGAIRKLASSRAGLAAATDGAVAIWGSLAEGQNIEPTFLIRPDGLVKELFFSGVMGAGMGPGDFGQVLLIRSSESIQGYNVNQGRLAWSVPLRELKLIPIRFLKTPSGGEWLLLTNGFNLIAAEASRAVLSSWQSRIWENSPPNESAVDAHALAFDGPQFLVNLASNSKQGYNWLLHKSKWRTTTNADHWIPLALTSDQRQVVFLGRGQSTKLVGVVPTRTFRHADDAGPIEGEMKPLSEFMQGVVYESCSAALAAGQNQNGWQTLFLPGIPSPVRAHCDQQSDGGGWMTVTGNTALNPYIAGRIANLESRMEVKFTSGRNYYRFIKNTQYAGTVDGYNAYYSNCKQRWAEDWQESDLGLNETLESRFAAGHERSSQLMSQYNLFRGENAVCHRSITAADGSVFRAQAISAYPSWNTACGGLWVGPSIIQAVGCGENHGFEVVGPEGATQVSSYGAVPRGISQITFWVK